MQLAVSGYLAAEYQFFTCIFSAKS